MLSACRARLGRRTVTNIGVFGGRFSQPILNAGQPIILGLGSVERRLVPYDRGLSVRALQPVSMAYDRNRLDEVEASRMLSDLRVRLGSTLVTSFAWSTALLLGCRPMVPPRSSCPCASRTPAWTRRALLAAAVEEFSKHGYEGARVTRGSPKLRVSRIS